MNWKLIFALSLFGIVMGIAGLFGYIHDLAELSLWLVIFMLYAYCIVQYMPGRYF